MRRIRFIPQPRLLLRTHVERGADEWFYRRVWKPAPVTPSPGNEAGSWMIFSDSLGLGDRIAAQLRANKQDVILGRRGLRL